VLRWDQSEPRRNRSDCKTGFGLATRPSAPSEPHGCRQHPRAVLKNGTCHDMGAWAARINRRGVAAILGSDRRGLMRDSQQGAGAPLCFAWRSVDAGRGSASPIEI
jgi:hypothetical protein